MRFFPICLGAVALGLVGAVCTFSLGQVQPTASTPPPSSKGSPGTGPVGAVTPIKPARDLTRLSPLQRQIYLSAQRGTEWLQRANRPDGRFVPGLIPALRVPLEGNNYLHQVAAAFTLARAAQFFQEERPAALARQALLTLLLDTEKDPRQAGVRHPTLPAGGSQRLAAVGWLILAINELPAPGADLLEQSEELCQFLKQQQRPGGGLVEKVEKTAEDGQDRVDPESAGLTLYALLRSQQHRQADWKLQVVRQSFAHYLQHWRQHKEPGPVSWLSATAAELYHATKEAAFAENVNELCDWLCGLQYEQLTPQRALWLGGFQGWQDGKAATVPPDIQTASYLEGLCQACRVARQKGDLPRHQRWHGVALRAVQFLTTLQYTEGSVQHFAEWYRPEVLGAFHAAHQDGNLRLDYTQQAVAGMLKFLQDVASPTAKVSGE